MHRTRPRESQRTTPLPKSVKRWDLVLATLMTIGLVGCGSSVRPADAHHHSHKSNTITVPSSSASSSSPSSSASPSATATSPSTGPSANALLSPTTIGHITHKVLVRLAGDTQKDHLIVVAHTVSTATLNVYLWHQNSWVSQWSKSWNTARTSGGDAQFQFIGAGALMGGTADQVVTTYWSTGGDAGISSLEVWQWNGQALAPTLTLNEPDGSVSASISGSALDVSGNYLPSWNTCMACSVNGQTTVTYQNGRWTGTGGGYYHELIYGVPKPPSNPSPSSSPSPSPSFQTNNAVPASVVIAGEDYWAANPDPLASGEVLEMSLKVQNNGTSPWFLDPSAFQAIVNGQVYPDNLPPNYSLPAVDIGPGTHVLGIIYFTVPQNTTSLSMEYNGSPVSMTLQNIATPATTPSP